MSKGDNRVKDSVPFRGFTNIKPSSVLSAILTCLCRSFVICMTCYILFSWNSLHHSLLQCTPVYEKKKNPHQCHLIYSWGWVPISCQIVVKNNMLIIHALRSLNFILPKLNIHWSFIYVYCSSLLKSIKNSHWMIKY